MTQQKDAETIRGGTAPPCGDGGSSAGRLLPGLADIGASWGVSGGGVGAGTSLGWNPSGCRLFPFVGGGGGGGSGGGGVGGFLGRDRWTLPSADAGAGFFGGSLRDGGITGGIGGSLASPEGQQDLGSILGHVQHGTATGFERRGSGGDRRGGVNGETRGGSGAGDGYGAAQTSRPQVSGPIRVG